MIKVNDEKQHVKKSEQINRILPVKCTQNEIVQERKRKLNIYNTNLKNNTKRQGSRSNITSTKLKLSCGSTNANSITLIT